MDAVWSDTDFIYFDTAPQTDRASAAMLRSVLSITGPATRQSPPWHVPITLTVVQLTPASTIFWPSTTPSSRSGSHSFTEITVVGLRGQKRRSRAAMPAGWCCPRSCLPGRAATVRVRQRCMPARSQVQERPSAAHSHVMPSVPIIATSRKIPSFYTREGSSGGGWRSEDRPRRKDRGLMSLYRCHLLLVRLRGLRACARAARAPGAQGRGAVCMALLRNWAASNCWAVTPGPGRVAGRDSQGAVVSYNGH